MNEKWQASLATLYHAKKFKANQNHYHYVTSLPGGHLTKREYPSSKELSSSYEFPPTQGEQEKVVKIVPNQDTWYQLN